MRFNPQTKTGKWSVVLMALWPLLTIFGSLLSNGLYADVEAGNGIIDDLRGRPMLAISMLLGMAAGITAFGMALHAIFRQGERSLPVFVAVLIGLFLTLLIIGELFIQH